MEAVAYILVSFNCLICLALFLRKRRINSPFQVLYLVILGVILVPGFLDINAGIVTYHPFAAPVFVDETTIVNVHSKILMFLVGFLAADILLSAPNTAPEVKSESISLGAYWAIPILLGIEALYIYATFGFGTVAQTSMDELREGPIGTYSLISFYLQMMIIGLPAIFAINKRYTAALITLGVFAASLVLFGGSRQVLVISITIFVFLKFNRNSLSNNVILLGLFVFGFEMIDVFLQTLKLMRNLPNMAARLDLMGEIASGDLSLIGTSSESVIRYMMYVFMSRPLPSDFGALDHLARTLLFWLPSALDFYSIKPADFEAKMFSYIFGSREGTLHPTLFGSVWADSGVLFPLWIILIAGWMRWIEGLLARFGGLEQAMVWSTCIYFSIMMGRGSIYAPFVVTFLVIGFAYFSSWSRRVLLNQSGYSGNRLTRRI